MLFLIWSAPGSRPCGGHLTTARNPTDGGLPPPAGSGSGPDLGSGPAGQAPLAARDRQQPGAGPVEACLRCEGARLWIRAVAQVAPDGRPCGSLTAAAGSPARGGLPPQAWEPDRRPDPREHHGSTSTAWLPASSALGSATRDVQLATGRSLLRPRPCRPCRAFVDGVSFRRTLSSWLWAFGSGTSSSSVHLRTGLASTGTVPMG